jgi:cellulose synthase/poly-beta-1,6-N-acetylglucosamine synthase-like glycosyltransferase
VIEILEISNNVLFLYYFLSNLIYLALLILALASSAAHQRRLSSIRLEKLKDSPFVPPIAVLVPAHNEEQSIVESVRALLALDYPELEIIVINDGSKDATLERLEEAFQLMPTDIAHVRSVECQPVRGVYMTPSEPRLLVVDKESRGSKADAVNAGLNIASSQYVCVVDADAILERDALLRIMAPVITSHKKVVAAGGIVRAINGCRVRDGRLAQVKLPRRGIEALQVVEYLRAFLIGREGWAYFNMLVIISGAFGVFQRDLLRQIGGYRASAIGEDLDVVVRMHRYLLERKEEYHISFVPDPVCWTEVPSDARSLGRQRARWQKGLMDVLWGSRDMVLNPRYGRIGMFALPYQWVFEFLAPWVEIIGYSTIVLAWLLGVLNREFFVLFLLFGYGFATMISIGSVLQEELTYKRYQDWKDVLRLIAWCFLEHFPYRQLQMWWRVKGTVQYLRGDVVWEPLRRAGFQKT